MAEDESQSCLSFFKTIKTWKKKNTQWNNTNNQSPKGINTTHTIPKLSLGFFKFKNKKKRKYRREKRVFLVEFSLSLSLSLFKTWNSSLLLHINLRNYYFITLTTIPATKPIYIITFHSFSFFPAQTTSTMWNSISTPPPTSQTPPYFLHYTV